VSHAHLFRCLSAKLREELQILSKMHYVLVWCRLTISNGNRHNRLSENGYSHSSSCLRQNVTSRRAGKIPSEQSVCMGSNRPDAERRNTGLRFCREKAIRRGRLLSETKPGRVLWSIPISIIGLHDDILRLITVWIRR